MGKALYSVQKPHYADFRMSVHYTVNCMWSTRESWFTINVNVGYVIGKSIL